MPSIEIIYFCLVGFAAGVISSAYSRHNFGLIGSTSIGVIGAIIGGNVFMRLPVQSTLSIIGAIVTACVGAVVLLLFVSMIKHAQTTTEQLEQHG